jgi:hypothetical protein
VARCDVCWNDYDKSFQLTTSEGQTQTFDSFECAIHGAAPECSHCGCKDNRPWPRIRRHTLLLRSLCAARRRTVAGGQDIVGGRTCDESYAEGVNEPTPESWNTSVRGFGPSNSRKSSRCQRPNRETPPATGMVTDVAPRSIWAT